MVRWGTLGCRELESPMSKPRTAWGRDRNPCLALSSHSLNTVADTSRSSSERTAYPLLPILTLPPTSLASSLLTNFCPIACRLLP